MKNFLAENKWLMAAITFLTISSLLKDFYQSFVDHPIRWWYIGEQFLLFLSIYIFLYLIHRLSKWYTAKKSSIHNHISALTIPFLVAIIFVLFAYYPLLLVIGFVENPLFDIPSIHQAVIWSLFIPSFLILGFIEYIYFKKSQYKYLTENKKYNVWDEKFHLALAPLYHIATTEILCLIICLIFALSQLTFLVSVSVVLFVRMLFFIIWYYVIPQNFPTKLPSNYITYDHRRNIE